MRQPRNWHTGEPLVERKVQQPQVEDVDTASFDARDGGPRAAGVGKDSQVTRSRSRTRSPFENGGLEIHLPSYKKYEANRDTIQSVENQLSKVKLQKQRLHEEMDRLEGAKATIQNIKRKKQIEVELRECTHNIAKYSRYLKEFD